jgi:hypothetical protein
VTVPHTDPDTASALAKAVMDRAVDLDLADRESILSSYFVVGHCLNDDGSSHYVLIPSETDQPTHVTLGLLSVADELVAFEHLTEE